ncbi:MAG: FUSC family protein, partial [Acidimicrobiales bacterium]
MTTTSPTFLAPTEPRWLAWLHARDPGSQRLRTATLTVAVLVAGMGAEYLFVRLTGALQRRVPAHASASVVAAISGANHAMTVVALMIAALIALYSGTSLDEPTRARMLVAALLLPIPLVVTFVPTLILGEHRLGILCAMPLVLGVGTLFRRFGPRGSSVGLIGFMGVFFGYFLHGTISTSQSGWIVAEVAVATTVVIVVRCLIAPPNPQANLESTLRSYTERGRIVLRRLDQLIEEPSTEREASLARALTQLNQTALRIDGILPDESASDPLGDNVRRLLFDLELSLTNVARFTAVLLQDASDPFLGEVIRGWLGTIASEGTTLTTTEILPSFATWLEQAEEGSARPILLRRLSASLSYLSGSVEGWRGLRHSMTHFSSAHDDATHAHALRTPTPTTTAAPAAAASLGTGRLTMTRRVAIQITLAAALAIFVGDLIDPARFYWAALAALLCFVGANSSGEQIQKGIGRVAGTLGGIVLGLLLAHLIGRSAIPSFGVLVVFIFIGVYLVQVNYAFLSLGITVGISLLYVQLNELSTQLLLIRLEETVAGALCGIAVALLVLPLGAHRVLVANVRTFLGEAQRLIEAAFPTDEAAGEHLGEILHRLDAEYQRMLLVVKPLTLTAFGEHQSTDLDILAACTGIRNYLRSLVQDVQREQARWGRIALPETLIPLITASIGTLAEGLLPQGSSKVYLRFSSQVALAANGFHA